MASKLVPPLFAGSFALLLAVACGSTNGQAFDDRADGGGGSSTNGGEGSSGSLGSSGGTSNEGGTDGGDLGACGAQTQSAEQLPLDILIMLDASGSMMQTTSTGATTWAAVKSALGGFINDAQSAGIGVGLQVFPIEHPGAPASCTKSSDCSVGGTSLGRCFLKACPPNATDPLVSCETNADCGGAPCRQLGQCVVGGVFGAGDCLVGGDPCVLGTCTAYKSSFCDGTECVASDYATPAVAIATLPGNAAALANELAGLPDPPETALTPTSVAVKVGVDIAKQHATAHPDHAVVVVLATDGLPTRCAPLDIGGIATLASAGVTGTPSIKTFVIGVFSDEEKATATTNLNAIATGGGTGTAFMVSTGANVTADFQAALNVIRATSLPCEYAVPTSDSGTPDYEKVNVQFTGGGKSEVLGYEKDAAGCDPQSGGWYYDTDPAKGGTPTKITLCPATCDAVKHTAGDAKVDILLGCKTIVK